MNAREIRVGTLRISPPLVMAPMAGLSHTAFRRLAGELGGVGLYFTEMLSARSLPGESPRASPYLCRTEAERPLAFQVLAASPEEFGSAAEHLEGLGADAVDLNLGCPAPEARRRGAGAWLAERPGVVRAVVAEARRRTRLPLTAKIRLGTRLDEGALRELCRVLEGEGIDLLTVHARLRGEPYGRPARWEWVGRVKSWVAVPVVGNGGIFSVEDARGCLERSGCDGLMLGRGAAVRPWLFARVAAEVFGAAPAGPVPDAGCVYERFLALVEESFAPERRLGRIKEFTHHYAGNFAFGHSLASAVQSSRSVGEAAERAGAFFADLQEGRAS